ncbi:hypothetical protein A2V82_07250 [candidate division KSB1 bacterium RBG_16_48_16]|nr:MAG: hypothetical protein A2V82_07250 [candidate division KSB1 bacterium RBG_16_48_16]
MSARNIFWDNKIFFLISIAILICGIAGLSWFFFTGGDDKGFQIVPGKIDVKNNYRASGTEVGTGWSIKENPAEAVQEAFHIALSGKKNPSPETALIFTHGYNDRDIDAILSTATALFENRIKIYGASSFDSRVMTDKGIVKVTDGEPDQSRMLGKKALVAMTIASKDITFGVGSADYGKYPSKSEAARAAILEAIKDAGQPVDAAPRVVLMSSFFEGEVQAIEGIENVVGSDTPVFGGNRQYSMTSSFGMSQVIENGISTLAIYTDLPVGYAFEGGFEIKDVCTGVVTKRNGDRILEIDSRPALEVYDEWLDGEVIKAMENGNENSYKLTFLNPLCKRFTSPNQQVYFLFGVPSPKEDKTIGINFEVREGDRIYQSRGTWEILLNRIGNLPRIAKSNDNIGPETDIILGIGHFCAGIMSVIPETEKDKIPILINYGMDGAPSIVSFTAGEQGHFPGVGNKAGHLLSSFLVIGEKR